MSASNPLERPSFSVNDVERNDDTVETLQTNESSGFVAFYSLAYTISKYYRQQQEEVLHQKSIAKSPGGHSPETSRHLPGPELRHRTPRRMDIYSNEYYCVQAWAILLSRSRKSYGEGLSKIYSVSEVTATMLQRKDHATRGFVSRKYTLYVAKNGGPSINDHKMIENILKWMKSYDRDRDSDYITSLRRDIFSQVANRIRSYLQLKNNPKFKRFHERLAKLENEFREKGRRSLYEFLGDWNSLLEEIRSEKSTDRNFHYTILNLCDSFLRRHEGTIAHLISSLENCDELMFTITGIQRLVKIPKALEDLLNFQRNCLADAGTFEVKALDSSEYSSPAYDPPMSHIRNHIKELSKEPKYRNLKVKLQRTVANDKDKESRMFVHCEMQLLNHILNLEAKGLVDIQHVYDYIGCSKSPCFLCAGTINLGTPFKVGDSHRKLYWKWGIPRGLIEDQTIARAILTLQYRMEDILMDKNKTKKGNYTGEVHSKPDRLRTAELIPDSPVETRPRTDLSSTLSQEDVEQLSRCL